MNLASLSAAALLGAASSAHCIAMCGPLVVAGCASNRGGRRSAVGYLAGRFLSYGAVGALAGGIGAPLVVAASTSREVRILVGFLLAIPIAIVAIRWMRNPASKKLIRLARKPSSPGRLFVALSRFIPSRGMGLGVATGFFPCGALASGLVVAAASGSALGGGLAMLAFAAASAPALLLVALFGNQTAHWLGRASWIGRARPIVGVGLLGLALWLATAPFLSGNHPSGGAACSCESEHAALSP